MQKSELREKVVDEFKSLVFGPRGGNDEFIEGKSGRVVALRYLTGILFPQGEKRSDLSTETDDESFSEEDGAQEVKTREDFSGDLDNPLSMANEELPSSVGITFVIKKNEDFNIHCSAARYERTTIKSDDAEVKGFKRIQLDDAVLQAKSINKNQDVFYVENEPRAKIHIFKRSSKDRKDCEIVTVTLVNELSKDKRSYRSIKNTEKRLYQVKLKCVAGEGKIKPYDSNNAKFKDTEENILSLQYSDSLVYAIGHGASVNWNENKNKKITEVEISYIPTEIVNRPIFDKLESTEGNNFNNSYIFNISNLADKDFDKIEFYVQNIGQTNRLHGIEESWPFELSVYEHIQMSYFLQVISAIETKKPTMIELGHSSHSAYSQTFNSIFEKLNIFEIHLENILIYSFLINDFFGSQSMTLFAISLPFWRSPMLMVPIL